MVDREGVQEIFRLPLMDLLSRAGAVHRTVFEPGVVQLSSLLSIKTGGCPENCAYCPQSAHHETGLAREKLMPVDDVRRAAQTAKLSGASRFCMGAAWRQVTDGPEFDRVVDMVREVHSIGLEVCCTLGMLTEPQAVRLKKAGLHSYNHNIDSSRAFYEKIISTRGYDDRLETIGNVRRAGLSVCTGGIIGMGETESDRIDFLHQLASFDPTPESVTVNALVPIEGTPLEGRAPATAFELARVIATARILMPKAMVRLSAGRKSLSAEGQLICLMAGANSLFLGDKLLTSPNPSVDEDASLFRELGLKAARGTAEPLKTAEPQIAAEPQATATA